MHRQCAAACLQAFSSLQMKGKPVARAHQATALKRPAIERKALVRAAVVEHVQLAIMLQQQQFRATNTHQAAKAVIKFMELCDAVEGHGDSRGLSRQPDGPDRLQGKLAIRPPEWAARKLSQLFAARVSADSGFGAKWVA